VEQPLTGSLLARLLSGDSRFGLLCCLRWRWREGTVVPFPPPRSPYLRRLLLTVPTVPLLPAKAFRRGCLVLAGDVFWLRVNPGALGTLVLGNAVVC
jgi:hypothetical protein